MDNCHEDGDNDLKTLADILRETDCGGSFVVIEDPSTSVSERDDHMMNDIIENAEDTTSDESEDEISLESDHYVVNNLDTDDNFHHESFSNNNDNELIQNYSKPLLKYKSQYSDVLNAEIVQKLENDLDFYEKISIVFLVYEDLQLEYALQLLAVASKCDSKRNLLSDWCRTEPKLWREKLLQALVVIKNFFVLSKLGYKKNDARRLFHKKNYIPSIRKKIYYFCESLSIDESKCLINRVNNDLKDKKIYDNTNEIIDFDPKFLELSFLFWLSRRYICFYSKDINLINMIECLDNSKIFCDIKKKLEIINNKFNQPRNKNDSKSKSTTQNSENKDCDSELTSVENVSQSEDDLNSVTSVSTTTTASSVSDNWSQEFQTPESVGNYYKIIDPKEIGLCIIINQKNFQHRETNVDLKRFLSEEILPDRDGTEVDVNKIKNTFSRLGYKIIIFNDLTHDKVIHSITAAVKQKFNSRVHSAIFLFILTHGYQGHVFACNSIALPIELIKKTLWQCSSLIGKPKGIIIQACQGSAPQEVVVPDGPNDTPVETKLQGQCDLFLGLATVPGHVAFRDPRKGTWFIQTLCECIEKFAYTTDFVKIFTRVNDNISKKRASDVTRTHIYGQVSECRSSLCLEWYLVPPKWSSVLPQKELNI